MAIYFDGDAAVDPSKINYGDSLNFDDTTGLTDWTCVVKFKASSTFGDMSAGSRKPIIGKTDGVNGWELGGAVIGKEFVNTLRFMLSADGESPIFCDVVFTDTTSWHTVLITSEQTGVPDQDMEMYLDNMNTPVSTASGAHCDDIGDLLIGNRTEEQGLDGHIAHAAFYNRMLSQAERNALLTDDPRTVAPSSLIFYSSCERGTTTTACRDLVSGSGASSVQTLTMEAERPSDFWPMVFGLRHCSASGLYANQTFFVFPSKKSISSAIIEIDEANTFDSDNGFAQFSLSGSIGSGTNYCWAPEATGLTPLTTYYYRLKLEDEIVPEPDRTFVSCPSTTGISSGTFVVGSCARFEDPTSPFDRREHNTLENALTKNPNFFVCVDDSIYADNGFHGDAWIDSWNSTDPHTRDFAENFGMHGHFTEMHEQIPMLFGLGDHEQTQDTDGMWKGAIRIGGNQIGQAPKYLWVNTSGSEYACTLNPTSGNPGFSGSPTTLFHTNDVPFAAPATSGTIGSLDAGEWGWGLYNGFYTIYIRLLSSTDPETYNRNIFITAADADPVNLVSQEYNNSYEVMRRWFFPGNPTPIKGDPSSPGDPVYFTFDYGSGFTFFMLDTRTQRHCNNPDALNYSGSSPPLLLSNDITKTVLGSEQEAALFSWIDNPANHYKLKIILSPNSLQEDVTNDEDGWAQCFGADLSRLKELLKFKSTKNIVLMAGDTHYKTADRFRTDGDETEIHAWDLWELCASPIDSNPLLYPDPSGTEISGVPNAYNEGQADYDMVYMLGHSTYLGGVPSLVVDYIDQSGTVRYTSNTFTWTDPGESVDLFIMGPNGKNSNATLFINGHDSSAVSGDLYISGPASINDQCDLFLRAPRGDGGILQSSGVIFYLNCDQPSVGYYIEDTIENKIWTDYGGWNSQSPPSIQPISGIINEGILPISAGDDCIVGYSGGYSSLVDVSGLCLAFWVKEVQSSDNWDIRAGFSNIKDETIDNGIRVYNIGTNQIWARLYVNGIQSTALFLLITPSIPGFVVVDIRYISGVVWNGRVSIDGSDWSSPIPITCSGQLAGSTYVKIACENSITWDEIILWVDNTLFTDQELSNLYELANTYGDPMPLYSSHYDSTFIDNSGDLFINGHIEYAVSGDVYIHGFDTTSTSGDLFIHGYTDYSTSGNLFTEGHIEVETSGDLFMYGQDTIGVSGDLFTKGHLPYYASGDLFIYGYLDSVTSGNLYILGHENIITSGDLFINSHTTSSGNISVFISGVSVGFTEISDSAPLFITSYISISGNANLFTTGGGTLIESGQIPLLINGYIPSSGNIACYISGIGFIVNDTSLFINGSGVGLQTGSTSLIINGYVAKPTLACPALDATASIQIKPALIAIYQSRIDALINQLGKNVYLEFDPIRTPCSNCTFDTIRKRSTGIYKAGGPRPFARGRRCPYCKGRGFLETAVNKCIKCLIKWNPAEARNFGIAISQYNGIVRLKTYLTLADDLSRARTIIVNHDIVDQMKLRVKLIQGPIPVGLREDRYCISFWELL